MHPLVRRDLHPDTYGTHQPEWTPIGWDHGYKPARWGCRHCTATTTQGPAEEEPR